MASENVIDYRPIWAPYGSITITKSDSTVLSPVCRRLFVGVGGTVTVRMLDGSTPQFTVVTGDSIDIQFDQVLSNGTGASGMVGLY